MVNKNIPIREMEADDVRGAIVSIPYPADMEEVVGKMQALEGHYAILPPYSKDRTFTARCAAVCRDRIKGDHPIIVAASGENRPQMGEFLKALLEEGFTNFAFPYVIGRQDSVFMLTQFWGHLLKDDHWYHIAGRKYDGARYKAPGTWTWSEEEL